MSLPVSLYDNGRMSAYSLMEPQTGHSTLNLENGSGLLAMVNRFYSLGSVSPCCAWYLPFLSAYDTSHISSL